MGLKPLRVLLLTPLVKTNGKVKPTAKQGQSLALNLAGTSEFIREIESKLFSAK